MRSGRAAPPRSSRSLQSLLHTSFKEFRVHLCGECKGRAGRRSGTGWGRPQRRGIPSAAALRLRHPHFLCHQQCEAVSDAVEGA